MRIPIQVDEASIEELLQIIEKESDSLINYVRKCKYINHDSEIHRLLDEENLKRYKAVNTALKFPLRDFDYDIYNLIGTLDEIEELSRLIQCWIILGSAIETSLQIFLAIYLNDYQNSNWGKWKDFNYSEVQHSITRLIIELRDKGHITLENSKTLKSEIKSHIRNKNNITNLEKLNLQNLIRFFDIEVGLQSELINALDKVRMNRNVVHSFKKRQVDGWEDLIFLLKIYCVLLLDLQNMMPQFDGIIDMMQEFERDLYEYHREDDN